MPLSSAPDLDLADAVVVLAGTGRHRPESGLAAVPAVRRTLAELKRVLVSRCRVAPANVVIVDPADPAALGDALEDAVQRAAGPLVFYFVGHGLVNEDGRLHLATRRTVVGRDYTALAYDSVRRRLRDSRSPLRIVILDCCFAGRAIDVLSPADDVAAVTDIDGVSVLASAGREELALAPADAEHTVFSGALLTLLTEGDPHGPELITLDSAVRYLRGAMRKSGYPAPRYARTGRVGELTVTTNPGWRPAPALPAAAVPDEASAPRARAGRRQVVVGLIGMLAMVLATLSAATLAGAPAPLVVMARADDIDDRLVRLWNAGHEQQVNVLALSGGATDAHRQMIGHAVSRPGAVDIYQLDVTATAEFAENGYITELPGPPPGAGTFLVNPLQTCRYGGRLWALPFTTDAGPARSRIAGRPGDSESSTVDAMEAVWAAGGDVVAADNRVDLQSPEARAGLRRLARAPVVRDVTTLPGPRALAGQNLAVASTSTQPLAARELIDFLTSPEIAELTFARLSGAPAVAAVYSSHDIQAQYPYASALAESIGRARVRPITPHYRQFSRAFGEVVADAVKRDGKVTDAQVRELEAILRGR